MESIIVENLGKQYSRSAHNVGVESLREAITSVVQRLLRSRKRVAKKDNLFWAMRNVGFSAQKGDIIGILGRNGAGKTTLLKLLCQVSDPTEGEIKIRGRIGSLLGANTGFHPELTGRENIYLVAAIMKLSRKEIAARFNDIVTFSEVESFLDMPVKHYSTGMQMKLGFSIAAHLLPDILILDEVLAVGDLAFQGKALRYAETIATKDRVILFVSHNLDAITEFCTKVMVIESGKLVHFGAVEEGIQVYLDVLRCKRSEESTSLTNRSGSGEVRVGQVSVEGPTIKQVRSLGPAEITVCYESLGADISQNMSVSLSITNIHNQTLFQCKTPVQETFMQGLPSSGLLVCKIAHMPLAPGLYEVSSRVEIGWKVVDEYPRAAQFHVFPSDDENLSTATEVRGSSNSIVVPQQWNIEQRN